MLIEFKKMSGAGNDFIVLDNRDGGYGEPDARLISGLCRRRTGIGGDGLILMENDKNTDFFMRYYNSDGNEAELCANGARCATLFAHLLLGEKREFTFRSLSGVHQGKIIDLADPALVEIDMPPPQEIMTDGRLRIEQGTFRYGFAVVGVPHVVLRWNDVLESADVNGIGRNIRRHRRFEPRGTNVNFMRVLAGDRIELRTYERGVEEETLACGTGSTVSAVISALWGLTRPPISCVTRGGEILRVGFELDPESHRIGEITLTGPARVVYEGRTEFVP